jgi:hypothetical protein
MVRIIGRVFVFVGRAVVGLYLLWIAAYFMFVPVTLCGGKSRYEKIVEAIKAWADEQPKVASTGCGGKRSGS